MPRGDDSQKKATFEVASDFTFFFSFPFYWPNLHTPVVGFAGSFGRSVLTTFNFFFRLHSFIFKTINFRYFFLMLVQRKTKKKCGRFSGKKRGDLMSWIFIILLSILFLLCRSQSRRSRQTLFPHLPESSAVKDI